VVAWNGDPDSQCREFWEINPRSRARAKPTFERIARLIGGTIRFVGPAGAHVRLVGLADGPFQTKIEAFATLGRAFARSRLNV